MHVGTHRLRPKYLKQAAVKQDASKSHLNLESIKTKTNKGGGGGVQKEQGLLGKKRQDTFLLAAESLKTKQNNPGNFSRAVLKTVLENHTC